MYFLSSLKYENAFKFYALLFIAVVFKERYFEYNIISTCGVAFHHDFFIGNYLRLLLLLLPFIFFSIFQKEKWQLARIIHNFPLLLLGCSLLALPNFQLAYIMLFILCSSVAYKRRAFFASMLLLTIGFTIAVLPQFGIGTGNRCGRVSSLKANAHTFQIMLETYALDWNGKYPEASLPLQKVALEQDYWKAFKNPMTAKSGHGISFSDISKQELKDFIAKECLTFAQMKVPLDILGIRLHEVTVPTKNYKGMVLYFRINPSSYLIYGVHHEINTLILDRGIPFALTNS